VICAPGRIFVSTLNGLPAHILLVHAIVVLLPLAAVLLVLTAVWPAARRRLAGPNALLSLGVLVLVPITTDAGEWLEHRVTSTPLIEAHAELGDTALFATVPVVILALIVWWRARESTALLASSADSDVVGGAAGDAPAATEARPVGSRRMWLAPASGVVTIAVTVLAVLAAGSAVYDTYRIGDSGAKASWQGEFNATPVEGGPGK
jgi:hypothetical protein